LDHADFLQNRGVIPDKPRSGADPGSRTTTMAGVPGSRVKPGMTVWFPKSSGDQSYKKTGPKAGFS